MSIEKRIQTMKKHELWRVLAKTSEELKKSIEMPNGIGANIESNEVAFWYEVGKAIEKEIDNRMAKEE